jgi:hypothetical protein
MSDFELFKKIFYMRRELPGPRHEVLMCGHCGDFHPIISRKVWLDKTANDCDEYWCPCTDCDASSWGDCLYRDFFLRDP